jgi:hypothetical protein
MTKGLLLSKQLDYVAYDILVSRWANTWTPSIGHATLRLGNETRAQPVRLSV